MSAPTCRSPHVVTLVLDEFMDGRMVCEAGPTASCRARFSCDCEEYQAISQNADGRPVHSLSDDFTGGPIAEHVGEYVADWCNVVEWFNDGDGADQMRGCIHVRVDEEWDGNGFLYMVSEAWT